MSFATITKLPYSEGCSIQPSHSTALLVIGKKLRGKRIPVTPALPQSSNSHQQKWSVTMAPTVSMKTRDRRQTRQKSRALPLKNKQKWSRDRHARQTVRWGGWRVQSEIKYQENHQIIEHLAYHSLVSDLFVLYSQLLVFFSNDHMRCQDSTNRSRKRLAISIHFLTFLSLRIKFNSSHASQTGVE